MRTIITFLNDKGLKEGTVYRWQGKDYEGGVFSLALRQFVEHDRMLVCNTIEAEEKTWPTLSALNDPRIEPVSIPKGENTTELWEMFRVIAEKVNENETVYFDITHGLRSLPFLVFLFAAYLKSAKRVEIAAIYYGALELGKPAPVIDLSEFVGMLDWLTATDQFVQTGDARRLAQMLGSDRSRKAAFQASQKLSQVSLAAFLCQPFTLMREAQTLGAALEEAQPELAKQTLPFNVMHKQITETFGAFGADRECDPSGALRAQFRLAEWYFQNNQLIQAITLAREWLLDAVTLRLGQPIDLGRGAREAIERAVTGIEKIGSPVAGEDRKFGVDDLNEFGKTIYASWDDHEELVKVWRALAFVRNKLDHAQHQKEIVPLETLTEKAQKEVMPSLRALAAKWGLTD